MATLQQHPNLLLANQLAALYLPIADDLHRAEEILRDELRSNVEFIDELLSRARLYQGKRLRPAILLLVAKACGAVRPEHHTLAAVIEMVHVATLVHDDILDEADTRRHVRTINAEWGIESSVMLGDYLFTHAFHLATSLNSMLACRTIGQATNLVCEGELHQISTQGVFELSETEYLDIVRGKTAELLAVSSRLGAHFAGADPSLEQAMYEFGLNLGIAFQIVDDLLDLVGDFEQTGKSTGADLAKQKATLPLIRLREMAEADVLEDARNLFLQPGINQRQKMLLLLRSTDAIEYTQERAQSFINTAVQRLLLLPESPTRDLLVRMTRFVTERNG